MKFYNWINESKQWYHGSYTPDIKTFLITKSKDSIGAYFTDDKKEAKRMRGGMPYIYTVEINNKKTLDLSNFKEGSKKAKEFLEKLPVSDDFIRMTIYSSGDTLLPYKYLELADWKENIVKKLKKKGYDSIKFEENNANTIVVFYPSIININKVETTS